jgi:hypothetical protein
MPDRIVLCEGKSNALERGLVVKQLKVMVSGAAIAQIYGPMERICRHCSAPFSGPAYRVKSEESGMPLLDMIVCGNCCEEAKKLGLHTEEAEHSPAPTPRDEKTKGR